MDWIQAAILGLVQGLTEFLPVSSTGHLILAERAMGLGENDAYNAFTILIQFGAIVAVVGIFFGRVKSVLSGLIGRDREGLRLFVNLVLGFLPAGVVGLAFGEGVKKMLYQLWVIAPAWLLGGLVILWLTRHRRGKAPGDGRTIEMLTFKGALVIGLFQVLALWPGVSRSLVTILGGLAVGLSMTAAVEFSFLLGVATLFAATMKEAVFSGDMILENLGRLQVAIGLVVAALSAAVAVKWMLGYLSRRSLAVFGWYRIALAVVTMVLLAAGVVRSA